MKLILANMSGKMLSIFFVVLVGGLSFLGNIKFPNHVHPYPACNPHQHYLKWNFLTELFTDQVTKELSQMAFPTQLVYFL